MTRYAYLLYLVVGFCCLMVIATGCNFEPTQTLQAATAADRSDTEYQGGVADAESLQALFSPQTESQDSIAVQEQSADLDGKLKLVVGQLPTGEVFYRFTSDQEDGSIDKAFDGMVYVNGQWRNFPRSSD